MKTIKGLKLENEVDTERKVGCDREGEAWTAWRGSSSWVREAEMRADR